MQLLSRSHDPVSSVMYWIIWDLASAMKDEKQRNCEKQRTSHAFGFLKVKHDLHSRTCLPSCLATCPLPAYLPTYIPASFPTYLPASLPSYLPIPASTIPTAYTHLFLHAYIGTLSCMLVKFHTTMNTTIACRTSTQHRPSSPEHTRTTCRGMCLQNFDFQVGRQSFLDQVLVPFKSLDILTACVLEKSTEHEFK